MDLRISVEAEERTAIVCTEEKSIDLSGKTLWEDNMVKSKKDNVVVMKNCCPLVTSSSARSAMIIRLNQSYPSNQTRMRRHDTLSASLCDDRIVVVTSGI